MHFRFEKFSISFNARRVVAGLMLALFTTCAYSASNTLLVLGDSLSAEYGLTRGSGWVALLQKRLESEKSKIVIVNASISGETTSGGKTRLPALLKQHQPAVVILELGANDGLRGLSLSANAENQRDMIKAANKAKAKVLLVGVQLPPNYGGDYAKQFFALYANIAKETRSSLVPFIFEGMASNDQMFQPDRLHPTAAAQSIILENIWPHLKPLLKLR